MSDTLSILPLNQTRYTFEEAVIRMLAYAKMHGFDAMDAHWGMATSVKDEVKRRLDGEEE